MENLLRFPPGKRRQVVRHIRRNPRIAPQLYFMTTEQQGKNHCIVSIEQAIWDRKRNQITSHLFMKHLVPSSPDILHCAIDENDKLIYLAYIDGNKDLRMEGTYFKYEKPDKLGYCRVLLPMVMSWEKSGILFQEGGYSLAAINVCPSSAKLILHCKQWDNRSELPQLGFFNQLQDIRAPGPPPYMNLGYLKPRQSQEMEARSFVFSRCNHLLVLVSHHDRTPSANALQHELRKAMPGLWDDGFLIVYSYDTELEPINILEIDVVRLMQQFLSRTLLDKLKTGAPKLVPDFMYFGAHLQLLGHVHKYVLFFFHHNYVLAAKWPKNWYKLEQAPEVQQKKVICVDKQKRHGEIRDVWLLSNDLYFKVELQGVEAIRKMSLSHKFKEYRTCAFCGKEEQRKRKNKLGKRISSYKVCRKCKQLNLHKYTDWRVVKCHYCSTECQRKHWKQHKAVHRSGNQRK